MIDISEHRDLERELLLSQKPYNMNFHPLPDDTAHLLSTKRNKTRLMESVQAVHLSQTFAVREQVDNVNSPAHYTTGKIECIDAIADVTKSLNGFEAYCTGNALKYLWRWKHKNGVEDLKKAQWYLNKLILDHDTTH